MAGASPLSDIAGFEEIAFLWNLHSFQRLRFNLWLTNEIINLDAMEIFDRNTDMYI